MRLAFIGDIMLSRFIGSKYKSTGYNVLDKDVIEYLDSFDFVFANLESPVSNKISPTDDHLAFLGVPELLDQFKFVNCFSLSNNHINDYGEEGITETIHHLDNKMIPWDGVFCEEYQPFTFESQGKKFALVTCTDMMNIEIEKGNNKWNVLKIDDKRLDEVIIDLRENNYFIILYAHVGMLFTRFPNPPIRNLIFDKIDIGVNMVITVHSHVLGGMEYYKDVPIFHSIGDFVMDGNSYRRRVGSVLELNIDDSCKVNWFVHPTFIDFDYVTKFVSEEKKKKILKSYGYVSRKLEKKLVNYDSFFKKQYRFEILQHAISTIMFLIKKNGFRGTLILLFKRIDEVRRVRKWVVSDRTKKRYDDDAILTDRKKFSQKELFGID